MISDVAALLFMAVFAGGIYGLAKLVYWLEACGLWE